jgi:hypothetical protein
MKKVIAATLIFTLVGASEFARAVDCVDTICVKVQADPSTGQIVITAEQNKPGSTPKPKSTSTPRPRSTIKKTPKPIPTTSQPRPKRTYKPRPKVTASAISLSDRITQLLPHRGLFFAPKTHALVGIPVYFWSDSDATFTNISTILGINVGVTLHPTFIWSFGDGYSLRTTLPGAPYPARGITHIYKKAGTYDLSLTVSWSGTWSAQGATSEILGGAIVQTMNTRINVSPAPTNFNK